VALLTTLSTIMTLTSLTFTWPFDIL